MLGGLTIQAILSSTLAFAVGFAKMFWVALVLPYPWFWAIVVVVLVIMRVWPSSRRR
jgi:hypothetical protein